MDQWLVQHEDYTMRRSLQLILHEWSGTRGWIDQRSQIEPNMTGKEVDEIITSNDMLL